MPVRGIRGAITVGRDDPAEILDSTRLLLQRMVAENRIELDDMASVFFSLSPDLRSEFPAKAARDLGWGLVPLFCARELDIKGGLKRCVRVLIHWNTRKKPGSIRHVYLRDAVSLRPDLSGSES